MDTGICKECGASISADWLRDRFRKIFDKIDSGSAEEITDVEESIYFNAYCIECSNRFLVDELRSQVYNDQ